MGWKIWDGRTDAVSDILSTGRLTDTRVVVNSKKFTI
jgi:hypothetical protein